MAEYLKDIYLSVTDVSSREAIGGLLVGFALALAASGAFKHLRKLASDPFPLLCGLILLVSAVSMALGVGHSRYKRDHARRSLVASDPRDGIRVLPQPIGRRLLEDADVDGDDRLTPEEAARFVKGADRAGKGWADVSDIDRTRRVWIVPRPVQEFHPDTTRLPPGREGF